MLRCDDPQRLQAICDGLSAEKIDALLRKWLRLLPHPYTAADRRAGYRYQVSILQAEFSLTQVLDRPVTGRVFFEEVIRENLDIGRPSQVQLIFDRRVTKTTPGRFRTRVITDGVVPSLHVDYKKTRIKQYHKEGRALRTETTINDTRDFGIGKLLKNLPALRQIGFQANRRLLDVQKISHDCSIGEDAFDKVVRPIEVDGQRAAALRFGDTRVQALFAVLVMFSLQLRGFTNQEMRPLLAQLLGLDPANYPVGRMTYDLRRLRLHGIIERIPRSHRYQLSPEGLRIALFFSRTHARLLRPKLAEIIPKIAPPIQTPLRKAFDRLTAEIDACCQEERLVAKLDSFQLHFLGRRLYGEVFNSVSASCLPRGCRPNLRTGTSRPDSAYNRARPPANSPLVENGWHGKVSAWAANSEYWRVVTASASSSPTATTISHLRPRLDGWTRS